MRLSSARQPKSVAEHPTNTLIAAKKFLILTSLSPLTQNFMFEPVIIKLSFDPRPRASLVAAQADSIIKATASARA
jgi:hypothetical protein